MSELFISRPITSEKVGVLAASSVSTVATHPQTVRVISNRNMHVRIGGVAENATTDDMLVYSYHPVFFSIGVGESVHVIRATGEIDGDAWITELQKAG